MKPAPRRRAIARVGVGAWALCVLAGCTWDNPGPMWAQNRASAYRTSDFFLDGRSMQPPVEGTVPRERPRGSEAFETGREGARWVERIPIPLTLADLQRGQHDYEIYCGACHGLLGDADVPVAEVMSLRPPPSLLVHVPMHTDGELFDIVGNGFGLMPGYAAEIPVPRRWALVGYLRVLLRSQRASVADAPPEIRTLLAKVRP